MLHTSRWTSILLLPFIAFVMPLKGDGGPTGELVYATTDDGVTVVDSATGDPMMDVEHAMPAGDWSRVIAAIPATGSTRVEAISPEGAGTLDRQWIDGRLRVRAVSHDGQLVALMPTDPKRYGREGVYTPASRRRTRIVVTRLDSTEPRKFNLAANVEPEAFSADGRALFVIQYKPALDPDRYRVRRLDLTTGELADVFTNDKLIQGDMRGLAFDQAAAPDGSKLYTLYRQHQGGTFVHLLDLVNQTAQCVLLPNNFGSEPAAMAITARPDGAVFVVDPAVREIAQLDPARHGVEQSRAYEMPEGDAPVVAAANLDSIFVAAGNSVAQLRHHDLEPVDTWTFESEVEAVHASAAGILYVALEDRLLAINLYEIAGVIDPLLDIEVRDIRGIGDALPATGKGSVQCAC